MSCSLFESRRVTPLLALAVCLLIAAPDAHAAGTFYVQGSNPSCSNAGPGTEAVPYCTITAAANARGGAGTLLLVKPATYREQVTVPASGASGDPFIIQALGSPVIVDGADDYSIPSRWNLFSGSRTHPLRSRRAGSGTSRGRDSTSTSAATTPARTRPSSGAGRTAFESTIDLTSRSMDSR
jgi:hypothetical protein